MPSVAHRVVSWVAIVALVLCVTCAYATGLGWDGDSMEAVAAKPWPRGFVIIPLGVSGGIREGSLTSFALASSSNTSAWILMDVGTVMSGLMKVDSSVYARLLTPAERASDTTDEMLFLRRIRSYLVSHGHLDHCEGLAVISPDDTKPKRIVGLNSTITSISKNIFNWESWPNMANEGPGFALGTYIYMRTPERAEVALPDTPFTVEAFPLSHSGIRSTAFFVKDVSTKDYVLYLGDTGPDAVENAHTLAAVWTRAAALASKGNLLAVFIECSFPNGRPDNLLFGHLTPAWLLRELAVFDAKLSKTATRPTIVVTHVKPSTRRREVAEKVVLAQLADKTDPNAHVAAKYKFVALSQGVAYSLTHAGLVQA